LGLLGILARRDVARLLHHGVGRGPTEQGEVGFRRVAQGRASPLSLGGNQSLAFLMDDLDEGAPPQHVLVPGGLADVGTAPGRGLIAHLITDRVAKVPGDGELVRRAPGGRRGDLHRAVVIVADPRPSDGDLAEGGLEGEGSCPPALDAAAGLAVPALEDQFLVGLLDEGPEEAALDHETGLMDGRLDPVGEMVVLVGQGEGHLQPEFQGERLALPVDGAEGDGSLEVVGVTHGESPYWPYGGSSCVFSLIGSAKSSSGGRIDPTQLFPILYGLPLIAHQLASARKISPRARQLVRRLSEIG
jgi:hypothetical protein